MKLRWYHYLVICTAVILLDRITKTWVMHEISEQWHISSWFSLICTLNRGVSFSLLSFDTTGSYIIVSCLVAGVCGALGYYTYQRAQQGFVITPELLVLAGGVSNLWDRIWYGGVVDFLVVSYKAWSWPACNLADCCIVIGLLLMCMKGIYNHENE